MLKFFLTEIFKLMTEIYTVMGPSDILFSCKGDFDLFVSKHTSPTATSFKCEVSHRESRAL